MYPGHVTSSTNQVTVQCDVSAEDVTRWNSERPEGERYEDNLVQELVMRYEAPVASNRWDSPLVLVLRDGEVRTQDILDALFNKKPPAPNQSTQNKPLSSTNFLYELDQQTQAQGDI